MVDAKEVEAIRVGVLGAHGRMGSAVCKAVDQDPHTELVGMIGKGEWLYNLSDAGSEVIVDFTTPEAVMDNIKWAIDQGLHIVVGTSGFTEERLNTIKEWLGSEPQTGVMIAPNFAIGSVLMTQFAAMAAPYFQSVEIVEMHHPRKLDAPSGTARYTAEKIAAARFAAGSKEMPDATTIAENGARGVRMHGIPVHSIRVAGLVAHQEILLGEPGETLTIRHDSYDRSSFMPGVLAAIKAIKNYPGLTYGLESILFDK